MTSDQKEILRHVVMQQLCRHTIKGISAAGLRLALRLKHELPQDLLDPDERDLLEILTFLKGMGFARDEYDRLGATLLWKPTPDGVLYVERNPF